MIPEAPNEVSDREGLYGFSQRNSERIATAVRRTESKYQNNAIPQRRQSPVFSGSGLIPVAITSNVIAGTEGIPSPFSCVTLVPTGNNQGWTTTGGQLVTGYNRFANLLVTATAAKPKSAWTTYLQNGILYLITVDCDIPIVPLACNWFIVTLQDGCINNNNMLGTSVSFSLGGNGLGADVVDGKVTAVGISNGGNGYSPTTPPAVTFTGGGGSGAAGVAQTSGAGKISGVTVTNPGSGYTTPPTISFAAPGAGAVAGAVLTFGARLNITQAGNYSWTVSPGNYWPATGNQALGFSATSCVISITNRATQLFPKTGNLCVQIEGCGLSLLAGASVTFTGTTITYTAQATSDGNGMACAVVGHSAPPNPGGDTYNVSVTADRFLPFTAPIGFAACSNDTGLTNHGQIPLTADSSTYTCLYPSTNCPIPVKLTLTINIPSVGSTTLTYTKNMPPVEGGSGWYGSLVYNYPACPATGCPAGSTTLNIYLHGGGDYQGAAGGILLLRIFPAAGSAPCFAAQYFIAGQMTRVGCSPGLSLTLAAGIYCTGGIETIKVTES